MARTFWKGLGQLGQRLLRSKKRSRAETAARRLHCEPLEQRRLLTASLTLTGPSNSILQFLYTDNQAGEVPSITGTDGNLTFTATGGVTINSPGITGSANGNSTNLTAFPASVTTIQISGPGGGGETFSVTTGGLTVTEGLQIDNNVNQAEFDGAVSAGSLVVNTPLNLNGGSVKTAGVQTYNNPVTLSTAATLTSTAAAAPAADITFVSTVTAATAGTAGLTVQTDGVAAFDGTVGATALGALDTSGNTATTSGSTDLNASVTTTGSQTYENPVLLTATITATSTASGTIWFQNTLDANGAGLQLNARTDGVTEFSGTAGPTLNALDVSGVTTTASGFTVLNASVTTVAGQTYENAVLLARTATLTSTGGNVSFASTVDSVTDVLANGSFETGGFAPWTASGLTTPLNGLNPTVATSSTPTYANFYGLFTPEPIDGKYFDVCSYDGNGPGTQSIVQTVNVPSGKTVLSFNYRAGWDLTTAAVDRTVTVTVTPVGNPAGAVTYPVLVSTHGTTNFDTGVLSFAQDLSLFAGQAVNISIDASIPENFSGPALLEIDGVHLLTRGDNSLTLTTPAGKTTFSGLVGNTYPLAALTVNGTTVLGAAGTAAAPTVTTAYDGGAASGNQTYNGPVQLGQTAVLKSAFAAPAISGGGKIWFKNTIDAAASGVQSLTVTTAGTVEFDGVVGGTPLNSLTVDPPLTTFLGADVTTNGAGQTYAGPVVLNATVKLTDIGGGKIWFQDKVDAATLGIEGLTVQTDGVTEFDGTVGTISLAALDVLGNTTAASGSTDLNASTVTTVGNQDYQNPVVLTVDTTIVSQGDVTFEQTVDSGAGGPYGLTVNDPGATWFEGNVGHTAVSARLAYLTTDAVGTTQLGNGGTMYVNTTAVAGSDPANPASPANPNGNQDFGDPVVLLADTFINAFAAGVLNPNVTFEQTVDSGTGGPFGLTVTDPGTTWFEGNVGHAAVSAQLAYLTTDAPGTTQLGNGGTIYVDTTAVPLSDPTTPAGPANHNGNQDFGDPVVLLADTFINAFAAGVLNPNVTFEQTVDSGTGGPFGLTVTDPGTTWFEGNVGHAAVSSQLAYLTTDAAGTTQLGNGGTIYVDTTAVPLSDPANPAGPANHNGNQDFRDAVVLLADTSINAFAAGALNPNVTFEKTVDSQAAQNWGLTVNDPGVTWFAGNVGAGRALGYLTTDAAGTTYLGSETVAPAGAAASGTAMVIDTQAVAGSTVAAAGGAGSPGNDNGDVDFKDAVLLYADTTITAAIGGGTNPNVTFEKTLDSQAAQNWGLAVNDPGVTWFAGNVGVGAALGYLTTDAAGTTYLGSETAAPPGAVASGAAMVIDTQAVAGSTVAAAGGAGSPGNDNGDVDFKDAVLLYADTTITAALGGGTNPNVTFEKTLDSQAAQNWGLAVNDPGVTWFAGNVGAGRALGYLTTDAAGTTYLGSENAAPPGAAASAAAMVIDTQAVVGSTVAAAGGAGSPGNDNGDVDFKDAVLLYADTTITAAIGGGTNPNVTFEKTLDSQAAQNWGLAVNDPGVTWFAGNVGAGRALGYLTTDAAGTTYLGSETAAPPGAAASGTAMVIDTQAVAGSTVAAAGGAGSPGNDNGDVDFKDAVLLYADTTITAALGGGTKPNVTFEKTVDSQPHGGVRPDRERFGHHLVPGQRGPHDGAPFLFDDRRPGNNAARQRRHRLMFDTMATAGSTVASAGGGAGSPGNHNGDQDYGDPVLLLADTQIDAYGPMSNGYTLPLPNVTFEQTVDSKPTAAYGLIVYDAGITWFQGNVGSAGKLAYLTNSSGLRTQLGNELVSNSPINVYTVATAPSDPTIGAGPTNHNGNQEFGNAVVLLADTNCEAFPAPTVNPNITFEQTVDSSAAATYGLTATAAGNEVFNGLVGNGAAANTGKLAYLWTHMDSTIPANGKTIFNMDAGSASANNGGVNLDDSKRLPYWFVALDTKDAVVFNESRSTLVWPSFHPSVSTTSSPPAKYLPLGPLGVYGQLYEGAVTLQKDTVLININDSVSPPQSSGGYIRFAKTIDKDPTTANTANLTIVTTPTVPANANDPANGLTVLQGPVGSGRPLDSLTVVTGGPMVISQNITTTGDININVRKSYATAGNPSLANDTLTVNPGVAVTSGKGNVFLRASDTLTLDADGSQNPPLRSKVSAVNGQVTLEIGYFHTEYLLLPAEPVGGYYNIGSYDIGNGQDGGSKQHTAVVKGQIITKSNSSAANVNGTPIVVNGGTGDSANVGSNVVEVQLATALLGARGCYSRAGQAMPISPPPTSWTAWIPRGARRRTTGASRNNRDGCTTGQRRRRRDTTPSWVATPMSRSWRSTATAASIT